MAVRGVWGTSGLLEPGKDCGLGSEQDWAFAGCGEARHRLTDVNCITLAAVRTDWTVGEEGAWGQSGAGIQVAVTVALGQGGSRGGGERFGFGICFEGNSNAISSWNCGEASPRVGACIWGLHGFYGQRLLGTGSPALERRACSFHPPCSPSSRERDAGRCPVSGDVAVHREMSRHSLVTPKQRPTPTFTHSKSPSFL